MILPSTASSWRSLRIVSSDTLISWQSNEDSTLLWRFTWCRIYACRSFLSIVLAGYVSKIKEIPAHKRTNRKNVDKNCAEKGNYELTQQQYAGFCGSLFYHKP